MSGKNQKRHGGTVVWVVALGLAALVALALGPALAGTANAAPLATAFASPATQWAYGGQGSSNGSTTFGATTITWNATFGWTVIYTATNTSPTTVMLEEQRTVGISLTTTLSAPNVTGTYHYHATENDTAFVNLTNASTVYVNGQPVPAIGIDNESIAVQAAVTQSLEVSASGHSHSAFLNVSGAAQGTVQFAPSLGLIPLNLTGVSQWNSSSVATPQASWSISYSWADFGWNGGNSHGADVANGSWTGSGPVQVTGYIVDVQVPYGHMTGLGDHNSRAGIVLIVQGPVDAYDGFLLVPHDFDLFGGAVHPYDSESMGSASVGYGQGETLFVSHTARGPMVTSAESDFGASAAPVGVSGVLGQATTGASPAASSGGSPSQVVYGAPMSVQQARAENACLTSGCNPAGPAGLGALVGVALVALAVAAVVGTVSVIEWRSYARRRSQKGLVGGYGESWTNGGPPAGALQAPSAPVQAPSVPEGPRPPYP